MKNIDDIFKDIKGKEPTFNDVKDGLNNIFSPFKDLYDKGCEFEKNIIDKIKNK